MLRTTSTLAASLALSVAGLASAQAIDPLVAGEAMVRVPGPKQLAACLKALSSQFPGVVLLDSIEGRHTHLIGYGLGPGQETDQVNSLLLQLMKSGTLVWGELNYEGQASEGRTDSLWVSQGDIGAPTYGTQYSIDLLGLDQAQAIATGLGVVVAILDTGVDASHPLLASSIQPGGANFATVAVPTEDVGDRSDNDGDGLVDEMVGHGTFVAGLVRLVAPDAGLLPITVLNSDGIGDTWSVARGIYHAIDHGADVINLSLGSTYHGAAVEDATSEARAKGVVVVAAAGNLDVDDPREYPACGSTSLGIAATDPDDIKAPFSNFSDKLDLAAPGHSLPMPGDPDHFDPLASVISSVPGGGYAVWRGTSFSTAFVSGAAAIVRAQHPEWPDASTPLDAIVPAIEEVLFASAVPLDGLNPAYEGMLGAGRLDCAAATLLGPPQPRPADLDFDGVVGAADLALLLGAWGSSGPGDLDHSGTVGAADLALLLGAWG